MGERVLPTVSTSASLGDIPARIPPQLATAVKQPPADGSWLWELKLDGYRMMTRIDGDDIRLLTKEGNDWSARLPRLKQAISDMEVENAWLDGELVVLNAAGLPDFSALQNAFDRRSTATIVMFVFDLMWLNGVDLRPRPLRERREILARVLEPAEGPLLRLSQLFPQDPQSLLASARKLKLEGLMGKRADAPYRSGRGTDWVKLKCNLRQEFVIGGFSRRHGATAGVQSLLLGVYELNGSLRFAGRVQPQLSPSKAAAFYAQALQLARAEPPFRMPPALERGRDYYWVEPELVCEVAFLEWTRGGTIRHPSFIGMRTDKPAREILEEAVVDIQDTPSSVARTSDVVCGLTISNKDRVIDPSAGHTKLEVVRYYEAIAEWALPHLRDRPLSLVRAPDGLAGALFCQKHAEQAKIPGVEELPVQLHPGHAPLLVANTQKALVGLAQMGVIELHAWNACAPDLDHPDRVIFDLDPDPTLPWGSMLEAAEMVRVLLDELELASFPKTSGGKGLHIVVPLTGRQSWEEVKAFSKAVAQHLARVVPSRFSAVSGPKNRVGKVFVDYLRNAKGATSVAAFSVRARPGMGVSMPVSWEEVPSLRSADQWTMQSAVERQCRLGGDVWVGYAAVHQRVTEEMLEALGTTR
ncbi:DNA ligase D [Burkholderia ubonensis]|uniref:DNA ligase D n=1 Tax=Burkholderia ubonensis TaxID=101571 RepID=UPI0009B46EC3|nr:DNA ligase D [Burkholderia ubonensis]